MRGRTMPRGSTPTVLFIDSDPDVLKLMEYAFRNEGLHVIACREIDTALVHVRRGEVDCVVVDFHHARTPECVQFLKKLRATVRNEGPPVLVTSATLPTETARQVLELGARKFIPKPFYPSEVLREVRAAVEGTAA